MKNQPNSRQFPRDEILANKQFHDLLYLLLQSLSEVDQAKNQRFVPKKRFPKARLSELCGYKARNTLYTHLRHLVDLGYLTEDTDNYYLTFLPKNFFLIPIDTALFLIQTQTENVIKVYVYLTNRWFYSHNRPFYTSYRQIADAVGLYADDNSTRTTISNILLTLHNNFLITTTEGNYPKHFLITNVSNIVQKRPATKGSSEATSFR